MPLVSSPARSAGALFGHFGDRIGRKSMLMLTMSSWAPHLPDRRAADLQPDRHLGADPFVLLRFVQGLGLGGEWGGAS